MDRRRGRALTVPRAAGEHWLACLTGEDAAPPAPALLGVLRGEGVGPEVTDAALLVLRRLLEVGGAPVRVEVGDGDDAAGFCRDVLGRGGAVLAGPLGHDPREPLGLSLGVTPVDERTALPAAAPLRADLLDGISVLVVGSAGGASPRRALDAAARLAARRRGALTVVDDGSGWHEQAGDAAAAQGVGLEVQPLAETASRLVATPRDFDVIAARGGAGDVLSDIASVLAGARATGFRGDFTPAGGALYRPAHGPVRGLAGRDRANPGGQLLALAMLLRVSFGLGREATAIETSLRRTWRDGHRTPDVAERGSRLVGTAELGALVAGRAGGRLAGTRRA